LKNNLKTLSNNAINDYLLNTKAKTTKAVELVRLKCFCRFTFNNDDVFNADWSILSKKTVIEFIEHKKESVQFNVANSYLTVLKLLSHECYNHDVINLKTYDSIRNIKQYKGTAPEKGRALTLKEVNKVKEAFNKPKNARDYRNYAIFSLAVGCGLRRNEISILNIEDIQNKKIHVTGKGSKARIAYLSAFTQKAIDDWVNQLTRKRGALFVHVTKGDKIKTNRLGIKGIHHVIEEIQEKCRIKKFTTHDLRRTFATTLLSADTDIFTVQNLLGHSDPMTTKRYDKRGENKRIRAVNSLPF
jgi:integrase